MAKNTTSNAAGNDGLKHESYSNLPLVRANFIGMAVSALLIVLGFALMVGGGSDDASFNPEIFSPRRIVVGPKLAFLGFVLMAVAIIVRPKAKKEDAE